jgi:cation:H+ antiporter
MELIFALVIFISCGFLLYFAGELIVNSLLDISKYLGITKFVISFFIMAAASALPNLFVGLSSAFKGIPELSYGDIMGNNIISITLAVGLAIIFSTHKQIHLETETTKATAKFTIVSAILPVIMIFDGELSRIDGLILILFFMYYVNWIFAKKERFSDVYEEIGKIKIYFNLQKSVFAVINTIFGIIILVIAAQGIIFAAKALSLAFGISLLVVGILIIGLGSALPEVYFAISSARRNETSMILGNLMGAVIIPATLILGTVAIIHPIKSDNLEFSIVSRVFLILSVIFFYFFSKTHNKITYKEGVFLMLVYVSFALATIIIK